MGHSNATGYRTAIVRGTVNPRGAATTYYWSYQAVTPGRGPEHFTSSFRLPAGRYTQQVHAHLKVSPGETYEVGLIASNHVGNAYAWRRSAFHTPQHPELSLPRLSAHHVEMDDTSLRVALWVRGAFNPYTPVRLFASLAPYHHWRLVNKYVKPRRHQKTRMRV